MKNQKKTKKYAQHFCRKALEAVRIHDQVVNRYDYALWKITRCFACGLRADAASLAAMAACVNEEHGKTVILSEEAATRENIIRLANGNFRILRQETQNPEEDGTGMYK